MNNNKWSPADNPSIFRRHIRSGRYLKLAFDADIEQLYRNDVESTARLFRVILCTVTLLIYLSTPFVDHYLLHPPQGFIDRIRISQFGIAIPLVLLALIATLLPPLQRYSGPLVMLMFAAMSLSFLYQRLLGPEYGYSGAVGLVNTAIMAMFLFAGLRLAQVLPLALLIYVLNTATEMYLAFSAGGPHALTNTLYQLQSISLNFLLGAIGCYLVETNARLNWLEFHSLRNRILVDNLTGTWSLKHFRIHYRKQFALARREQHTIALAIIDIDQFKAYNDHYGHLAGDQCLATLGHQLNRYCQQHGGICARLGGEEFAAMFYGLSYQKTQDLIDGLKLVVRELDIEHPASRPASRLSVSIGGVWLEATDQSNRFAVLRLADQCLYAAKSQGRDRVVLQAVSGEVEAHA